MNLNYSDYKDKLQTADEAVKCVKSGDWIDYTMGHGIPYDLDKALAKRKNELRDIKVRGGITTRPLSIIEEDPNRETFTYSSWHFTKYDRDMAKLDRCFFIPLIYREQPQHYKNQLQVDVAMVAVSPMDDHGYFSLSLMNSSSKSVLDKAKIVIVEVNEKLPRVYGLGEDSIHISDVDIVVESSNKPPATLPTPKVNEIDEKIAKIIIPHIESSSLLQLGIGSLPNIIGSELAKSDLKDLGMHTEMVSDAYLELYKAGKLSGKAKKTDPGIGVWSFALGSQELYDWLEMNSGIRSAPIYYTNDPYIMSKNDKLICINNCIEVDITGQVCSESVGSTQISGTGGQLDFVTGASLSRGGKSFICLSSAKKDKDGNLKSNIVPNLKLGSVVSTPRSQSTYVVTEYGIANLIGCTTWERTERLISIAHPDFREELEYIAKDMRLLR